MGQTTRKHDASGHGYRWRGSITSTHTVLGWVCAAGVPHWITVKSNEDLQLWSPWQRVSLWARQLPAEDSKRSTATEQMMPLSTENNWLLPTHRAAHALLTAHWIGPLCIHSCSKHDKKVMSECVQSVCKCCMAMCVLWHKYACARLWLESTTQRYKLQRS